MKKGLKKLLNLKMKASREGDGELLKNLSKLKLRASKEVYREKLEGNLQQNNMQGVWPGMKKITAFKVKGD